MISKYLDGKRIAGFLNVDFPFLVPCNKRVSFKDVTYFVGYSHHGSFKLCHQCDDLSNATALADSLQAKTPFKVLVVCLNAKTSLV